MKLKKTHMLQLKVSTEKLRDDLLNIEKGHTFETQEKSHVATGSSNRREEEGDNVSYMCLIYLWKYTFCNGIFQQDGRGKEQCVEVGKE